MVLVNEYRQLLVFGLLVIAAIGLSAGFTYWQVTSSQHNWCQALRTITEHPVPKPTDPNNNPSRRQAYILYQEFVNLKGDFGCG